MCRVALCRVMMSCVAQYDYVSCGFSTTFHISLALPLCVVAVVEDVL